MSTTRFDFDGKVAIVTGAAQGIGAACAERLARVLDDRQPKALERRFPSEYAGISKANGDD